MIKVSTTVVYEYFDFNQDKPDIFSYNLDLCYNDIHSKNLMLKIDRK